LPRTHTLNIERLTLEHIELHFRKGSLLRAGAALKIRKGIRLCLQDRSGARGIGEALPLPSAGTEPMHEVVDALLAARQELEHRSGSSEELLASLRHRCAERPAARCALDVALHDLEARLRGMPLAKRLSADARNHVEVNTVIAAHGLEESVLQAALAVQNGYRTLKLKLGRSSCAEDVARVAAIRAELGSEIRLRLDANGSWSLADAQRALDALAELDIEMIEQPVAPADLDSLALLHARSPIPIAADESLASPEGRARLMRGELAAIAIVKPMVQGGLCDSAHLCREAAARGVRIVVTTTFDGPAATAAALHLAAAFGSPTLAHGLASCDVLDCEFPDSLVVRDGRLYIGDEPGLGLPAPPPSAS